MENEVALISCDNYRQECVQKAVDLAISKVGGLCDVKPGDRVVLKANLLKKNAPEDCVTTHPSIIEAIAKRLMEQGAKVVVGDSPGGPFTREHLSGVYAASGMQAAQERTGFSLNYDTGQENRSNPGGVILKQLNYCRYLEKADWIIDVAKLKTHGMTGYTGAVKNLFGTIPGRIKTECHYRFPAAADFCEMLIDLAEYVTPRLSIIDAVYGMEGEGPSAGEPRKIGCIIASKSPYAADLLGSWLIGFAPEEILTVQKAIQRGLCPPSVEGLRILGEDPEKYRMRDFKTAPPKGTEVLRGRVPGFLRKPLGRMIQPKPIFHDKTCIGCGECMRACPPRAIRMEENRPRVDLDRCIRCFCCQELCPKKAVRIKRSKLIQLLK